MAAAAKRSMSTLSMLPLWRTLFGIAQSAPNAICIERNLHRMRPAPNEVTMVTPRTSATLTSATLRSLVGLGGLLFLFFLLVVPFQESRAQSLALFSRNHPELDWRVATTDHFEIVHPARLDSIAARAAPIAETTYDSLAGVPDSIDIGVIDVFRPSEEAGGIVDAAIERAERVGDVSAVWLQLDITDAGAGERAAEAGLDFVQNRCLKVEHQRLRG